MFPASQTLRRAWPALAVLAVWGVFLIGGLTAQMIDFEVNYRAGQRLVRGETLYPGPAVDGHYEFKYPPAAAILYLPLALVPLGPAKGIWALAVVASVAAGIGLSWKLAGTPRALPWILSALPFLVLARYFLREVQLGQVNALLSLLLLLMAWGLVGGEGKPPTRAGERWAGLAWGLAVAIKPYGLIFLPYLLFKRKWRALFAGSAVLGAGFLAPVVFYGFSGNLVVHGEWIRSLSRSTPHLLSSQDNISLMAMAVKTTGDTRISVWIWAGLTAALAALFLAALLRGRRIERAGALESAALMLLIPLLSPLGWDYTLLLSLPALTLCIRHLGGLSAGWRVAFAVNAGLIALTIYDLLGRQLYARFMSLSLPTVFFLILFGYVLLLRWRERA